MFNVRSMFAGYVAERVGGNKARAAELLGLGRAAIYQILSRMKIEGKDVSA
jgi:hypothetical protein